VGCRRPQRPAGDLVEFVSVTPTRGTLLGICPTCERLIRRAASRASLPAIVAGLELTIVEATERLRSFSASLANDDTGGVETP
jgi:hypothetical protein